ncbi:amidohydrolase family protein [Pseudomaricurvus alkylphenolicus]|uniref:amidohydrolase family protein n=1 Tax=Pseudomaricurvus alkylphenolicus TaxID=1306991 RepID=UPI0014215DAD|nr:amidohydrolase family protein [Pseudomaricurvus alkylphenolicus]
MKYSNLIYSLFLSAIVVSHGAVSAQVEPGEEIISKVPESFPPAKKSPARGAESEGPFDKLIIKNVFLIDGTGAPNQGPVNIVIENDRITAIEGTGVGTIVSDKKQNSAGIKVIDASGQYAIPGMIDAHAHLGSPYHAFSGSLTDAEYVNKLWLAHGVTTVRDVGALLGLSWTLENKRRSANNEITAPRMVVFALFPEQTATEKAARKWVRAVKKRGADGIKLLGAAPKVVEAAIKEAKKLGMKTTQHHSQVTVTRLNVLDTARMGLDSMEHWYGLPEAMFEDRIIQDYPYDYNFNNEQDRFGQAGRLWLQAAAPGSEKWNATIDELIGLDFTIDPTFTIYEANRDLMREQRAVWHDEYTMPYIARSFQADPHTHGSYFFNWTTADEIAWKKNYRRWMTFINDYKNKGGRVTVGSDSGFIWKIYGFGYIRELELLQEAGFHPLEVLKSATINGAELLGMDDQVGSIQVGKKADIVIVNENPIANFKVLYGTGHQMLDSDQGKMVTSKGILYTIKDGIVYDAKKMLEDVRELVFEQKVKEAKQ